MAKKLLATVATFTLACACAGLPATASAVPELTHPTGTRLATGVALTATNVGEFKFTEASGNTLFACSKSTMTAELTKNSGSEIEATIATIEFSGTHESEEHHKGEFWCTAPLSGTWGVKPKVQGPWCLRSTAAMAADEFQIRGGGCSEGSKELRFTLLVPGECVYGRAEPLKGTLTTDTGGLPGDGILTLTNQAFLRKSGLSLLCPTEYKWDINYTLETDKTIAEPLYFS